MKIVIPSAARNLSSLFPPSVITSLPAAGRRSRGERGETRGQERVKKLVFEAKLAARNGASARSSAILSPALVSVQLL